MRYLFTILAAISLFAPASSADAPAPTPAAAHYEVKFMTGMIDHHAMAVMMADMCLDPDRQLVHPELATLCQNIKSTQTQEIQQMQAWLQAWYGISYQPDMKMGGQMKKMASMTGAMFEIEFMEMMIRHHTAAVKEGEHCLRKAFHDDLKTLCSNIIRTQTMEIQLMQQWLCAWYHICDSKA